MSEPGKASLSIEQIAPVPLAGSGKRDSQARAERESWKAAHQRQMAELERQSFQQDTAERKAYATKIYVLMCVWLIAVVVMISLSGVRNGWFELSEKVLLALIGSTTVNVIGLFAIVANYLFSEDSSPQALTPSFAPLVRSDTALEAKKPPVDIRNTWRSVAPVPREQSAPSGG